jgi:membrane peptidoglycan carboxypeptidase
VGYTPRVVAAVWMGFDEPRPIMAQATGGRLAAPVWGRTFVRVPGLGGDEAWPAPASVVQASIDPATGLPLAEGCASYWGEAQRELFLRRSVPGAVCPDEGGSVVADDDRHRSDEEDEGGFEPWPEEMRGGSHPAPPPEYEEAETWRRARREAEKAWREARKEYERELKEWRKEQRKRRRDQREER